MPYFSLTLADDYGRTTRKLIEIVAQTTLADYVTLAGAFMTHLEAVTDLGVIRCDLVIDDIDTGFALTSGANVDVGATFSGYIHGGGNGKKASLKLPGIKATMLNGDGTVDLADAAIIAFLAYWLDATPEDMLLSDGEHISSWIRGKLDK